MGIITPPARSGVTAGTFASGAGLPSVSFADPMFGGKLDGTTNTTAALAAFLSYCAANNVHGVIPKGTLLVNPQTVTVTGDLKIECHAVIKNASGTSATNPLLSLAGNSSNTLEWRGGFFNLNGGAFSGIEANNWAAADVYIDGAANLTATPASYASTSALSLGNIAKWRAGWGIVSNFSAGTNTQGSVPRVFSVSSNVKSDGTVTGGDSYNVHGTIVVGDMVGGTVRIRDVSSDTHADNFIYNVGNAAEVALTNCNSISGEEIIVNTGSGRVVWIGGTIQDFTTCAADWGHTGSTVGAVVIQGAYIKSDVCGSTFRSRTDNTAISEVVIRGCTIDVTPTYPDDFQTGKINKFVFENNRYTTRYSSARRLTGGFISFGASSCDEFSVTGNTFELYDSVGDIPAGDFFINLPNVTKLSKWDSTFLNKTGNNGAHFRLSTVRQKLVEFNNLYSQGNINRDAEANYDDITSAASRRVFGDGIPTSGYWNSGDIIDLRVPAANGAVGYRCYTSGAPGLWARYGTMGPANAEVQSFIDRMRIRPGQSVINAVDAFVSSLKTAGVFSFDFLYIWALHDVQAAKLNLMGTSYPLTANGTVTFAPGTGIKGDGTTGYWSSTFNPALGGALGTQNNHRYSVWFTENVLDDNNSNGNANLSINPKNTASNSVFIDNAASADTAGAGVANGLWALSRSSAASYDARKNGSLSVTKATASIVPNARNLYFGAINAPTIAYSTRQLALASYGPNFDIIGEAAFYNAANTMLTALSV